METTDDYWISPKLTLPVLGAPVMFTLKQFPLEAELGDFIGIVSSDGKTSYVGFRIHNNEKAPGQGKVFHSDDVLLWKPSSTRHAPATEIVEKVNEDKDHIVDPVFDVIDNNPELKV